MLWQITLSVPRDTVDAFEAALVPFAVSQTLRPGADGEMLLEAICSGPPEPDALDRSLSIAAAAGGIEAPLPHVAPLPQQDWVALGLAGLEPVHAGRFMVRGTHHPPKPGTLDLMVEAGQAFGTGHHASTAGCLEMLAALAKGRRFRRPLDMGCGSGVLTMAMARLWHCPVLGVDIDPLAAATARENARLNRLSPHLRFVAGNGYGAPAVGAGAPFDIVAANILARPLAKMAPALSRALAPGGLAILAGLLNSQETYVLAAHRAAGLLPRRRWRRDGWSVLVLQKVR
ncbi:MAG: 50S ribosomal protein L11 methyltransferase [Alphaproteobacteria bacterium]|jgi:ribosomal protein L11 methyltransferase|nr:50S ribosomal protein L11 methyltransferase [Alphaproteobacteria bacterium]